MGKSPRANGFSMPAEWHAQTSVWSAWPSDKTLWLDNITAAQDEFVELCRALGDQRLNILVPNVEAGAEAERRLKNLPVTLHLIPFGDIWLRDTAPIFVRNGDGEVAAVRFDFNGWGNKFDMPGDDQVGQKIASASGLPNFHIPLVLEGGSVEVDGEGTCLTSRQCLLNANRNPGWDQTRIEAALGEGLGVEKVLWLGDGLLNDHTDGHIDTIARFVAPGHVVCMSPAGANDPNREILDAIAADLRQMADARGRTLHVSQVTSPGEILNSDGDLMPASYLNFYIGNSTVVVPTYGSPNDAAAVAAIAKLFPSRKTVGRSAKAILSGGGAFHCITQQQPKETA